MTPDELDRRIIEPSEFVADTAAFVDVRLPRSHGKASYSMIGPGVSQNAGQTVNLTEPHGFHIGAAAMPNGRVNNPHLHFTAEVFICTRGRWRMKIGEHGNQQVEIGAGTIMSIPTWVFRGFENIGDDDGWLFTVLGHDRTGGIVWAPSVLRAAAETGLYLGRDQAVRDAAAGDPIDDVVEPATQEQLASTRAVSNTELAERVCPSSVLDWSYTALLSSVLDGHHAELAPVIGYGMTEDRSHRAPIPGPHGFSVEWLRLKPGHRIGEHRTNASQVVIVVDGQVDLYVDVGDGRAAPIRRRPATGSVVSIPPGAWRDFVNSGEITSRLLVVNGGDARIRIDWSADVQQAAHDVGIAHDAAGYLAPVALVGASSP